MMVDNNRRRTDFAFDCIKDNDQEFAKKHSPLIKQAPLLIRTNGFGNAMLYFKHKGAEGFWLYNTVFMPWLKVNNLLPAGNEVDLVHYMQSADQQWYIEAKEEAYRIADILKFVFTQLNDID